MGLSSLIMTVLTYRGVKYIKAQPNGLLSASPCLPEANNIGTSG